MGSVVVFQIHLGKNWSPYMFSSEAILQSNYLWRWVLQNWLCYQKSATHRLPVTSNLFLFVMPFISALQNYSIRGWRTSNHILYTPVKGILSRGGRYYIMYWFARIWQWDITENTSPQDAFSKLIVIRLLILSTGIFFMGNAISFKVP